jgi:hypothetical protein
MAQISALYSYSELRIVLSFKNYPKSSKGMVFVTLNIDHSAQNRRNKLKRIPLEPPGHEDFKSVI